MNASKRRHGFTLTEMLVTITIVVILAALILMFTKQGVGRAREAVCMSRLDKVGKAIQSYAYEHASRLPGPLYNGQSAIVGPPRNLATFIAEYMQVSDASSTGSVVIQNFSCPAWQKKIDPTYAEGSICYQVWGGLKLLDGRTVNPWTYPKPWGTPQPTPPTRIDEFDPVAANGTIALIEQDALLSNAWGTSSGPATPVHGNHRIALYFDWSAKAVPVPAP